MEHSFDIRIAEKYGVNCAIILKDIYYWVKKNIANNKHNYDGAYWTYNSIKAFEEMYPYLSKNQISGALKKLKDEGLIVEGNYNRTGFDRTKWYALTGKGFMVVENATFDSQKEEIHFLKSEMESEEIQNGNYENQKPIPYTITYTLTNNSLGECENDGSEHDEPKLTSTQKKKLVNEMFERLWKQYPRKMGKGNVSYKTKEKIFDEVGEEQFANCIRRYKDAVNGRDTQYIAYGSSFFNSGYEDFLDSNFIQSDKETVSEDDCFPFQ